MVLYCSGLTSAWEGIQAFSVSEGITQEFLLHTVLFQL
jgi:hypothetical protein